MHHPRFLPQMVLALVALAGLAGCPQPPDELDAFISYEMERAHVPGLSACIVKNGEAAWTGAYGVADTDTGAPVREDTLFMLASVSKTVTATALMQLYEEGLFGLDDDVNDFLSFLVRNPLHPGRPITFRMLLAHASSIQDNAAVMNELYVDGDSPVSLGRFLEEYLVPGGEYFRAGQSYHPYTPGVASDYSNVGMTLAGYLVEVISGMPFDQYCEQRIFIPLGMQEAGWFLRDLSAFQIARPHEYAPLRRDYTPLEHYGYPDYPDGQLRASARAYARLLAAFLGNGEVDGSRILREETVEEMLSVPFPDLDNLQAHGWFYMEQGGELVPGHNGGDRGVATLAFFVPESQTGVVVLMNAEPSVLHRDALELIGDRLLEEADRLPAGRAAQRKH